MKKVCPMIPAPRWALSSLALLAAVSPVRAQEAADLILMNGQVQTSSGWAQALAVRQGVIVAVGDDAAVAAHRGAATRVHDLRGAAVLPGLHDMHVHVQFAGLEQFACGFPPGAKPEQIVARVKACAASAKPGEWILGGNWVGAVFAKGEQTAALLDKAAPDNPVLLADEAHHSIWVNSRALALAGITKATVNPPGGIIERDRQGRPTGVFREKATSLVEKIVPEPSPELKRKALQLATNQMLSFGITAFQDASVREDNIASYASFAREGGLRQRVRGCIVWAPGDAVAEGLIAMRAFHAAPRFRTSCVKIFLDGVPTESHTAAMLEPYVGTKADDPHASGLLFIPQPVLDEAVARFDRMGLHIKFHAVGDGAVRSAVQSVERARQTNGRGGAAHEIGHGSFIDPADVPRIRDAGMTFEFSPYIWFPTPITSVDVRRAVGDARFARFTPIGQGVASGGNVIAGSDWSVVPSVNPWLAIETMVTRQVPGGGGDVVAPAERITLEQAVRIFTANAARAMGHRDQIGSIEPGMRADVVVTERNPFSIPIAEVHKTKVLMTFIDGEKVYDAASPPPLTAQ